MNKKQLATLMDGEIKALGEKLMNSPWENEEFYKGWLAQTYYLIRHTTKFLALSAARLPVEARDHHYAMLDHIKEELNHDFMPMKDLENLGGHVNQYRELPETEMIRQLQYYWIEFENPLALCGYAFILEGAAKFYGPRLLEVLESKYGKKATVHLRVHAVVDQDHYEEGQKFLATLSDKDCECIAKNMQQAGLLYIRMMERMAAECAQNKLRKAA
ncbi:iron-containing redox enzyme family protein [Bdellovibrio bacteriovorus]|uniref:iron-containing redox enzyme family protein n=1 Tax=Bdellovibrio TaxID=958 RepID=UPI0035A8A44A